MLCLRQKESSSKKGVRRMSDLNMSSAPASNQQKLILHLGAWPGIVGPILFTVVYTLDGWFQPHYSAIAQPVSYLSVAENGWIQIANFIVLALFVILFALSFSQWMRPLIASRWVLASTILLVL